MISQELLDFNQSFVKEKKYEPYQSGKFPKKKLAIVSCMDARLTELLPAALGLKNGDAKFIKNAGAIVGGPYGDVMRSLLIAVYTLGVEKILVIGHTECGVEKLDGERILKLMEQRRINSEQLSPPFDEVETCVKASVSLLREHPLLPDDIEIDGCVIDIITGELFPV